jgi:hypothetical protein
MAIYRMLDAVPLIAPTLVVALDGWVDAGLAGTLAAAQLAEGGSDVATFDGDALYDYRARRPTLEIVDGRLAELTWPELSLKHTRIEERDLLILTGHEPDYRWRELASVVVELAERLEIGGSISLGAVPAAVPHTRDVPILGTQARPGLLRADVEPGPEGILRVPSAAVSVIEMTLGEMGVAAVGYFAQVPHYVSGPYPAAAVGLLRAVGRHLGIEPPLGDLPDEARQLRTRLDVAASGDDSTRGYVERLESMVDEARQPVGDDLIADIERFLRDRSEGGQRS